METNELNQKKIELIEPGSTEGKLLVKIDDFLKKIQIKFSINEDLLSLIDGGLTRVIIGDQKTEGFIVNIYDYLSSLEKEQVSFIVQECKTFLKPLISNEITNTDSKNNTAPSPLEALASIKDRLSQNSVVAPIARDYSIEKIQTPQTAPPPVDPYRELPEK